MEFYILFFKAFIIGFAIAAPVGPIGLLCINKTLKLGIKGTLAVGLGAALADAFYGIIASLGLNTVNEIILGKTIYIKIFGGFFLLYLAYNEIKESNNYNIKKFHEDSKKIIETVRNVFFLTISNPLTILSFIAVFASIGDFTPSFNEGIIMVLGIFIGSMFWWLILGSIVLKIKNYLPSFWINNIKKISAVIIAIFGIIAIISVLIN